MINSHLSFPEQVASEFPVSGPRSTWKFGQEVRTQSVLLLRKGKNSQERKWLQWKNNFFLRVSLCSSGWSLICGNPPASASWVLGLQRHTTLFKSILNLIAQFEVSLDCIHNEFYAYLGYRIKLCLKTKIKNKPDRWKEYKQTGITGINTVLTSINLHNTWRWN